jgi:hypothetical protein
MIVFTGHGGAVIKGYNKEECIELLGGNLFPISSLCASHSKIKRTVIIDACRCFTWLNESVQLDKDRMSVKELTKDLNAIDCRDYYNELISDLPEHYELIQSTQLGEVARASQTGSVFCDALFTIIYGQASTWNMAALCNNNHVTCKSTEELVHGADGIMSPIGQHPQFSTNCLTTERFPFYAVRRQSKLI